MISVCQCNCQSNTSGRVHYDHKFSISSKFVEVHIIFFPFLYNNGVCLCDMSVSIGRFINSDHIFVIDFQDFHLKTYLFKALNQIGFWSKGSRFAHTTHFNYVVWKVLDHLVNVFVFLSSDSARVWFFSQAAVSPYFLTQYSESTGDLDMLLLRLSKSTFLTTTII